MSTSLVPAESAPLVPRAAALSLSAQVSSLSPSRVIDVLGKTTIYYFEQAPLAGRRGSRTCAYISHDRGGKTFTMAYHPLDRNDQVVQNLPLDQLGAAIEDLLQAGFGSRPVQQPTLSRSCLESGLVRTLTPAAQAIAGSTPAERTTLQLDA